MMSDISHFFRYASFSYRPTGGNPAGVVLDASGLSDEEMQAIAAEVGAEVAAEVAGPGGTLLVVTDARRREVYWAAYDGGRRISGPHVEAPAVLADRIPGLGAVTAAGASAGVTGLRVLPPDAPGPAGLVACALDALRAGVRPGPLEPLYLRRPDAVAPGPRKPVTSG